MQMMVLLAALVAVSVTQAKTIEIQMLNSGKDGPMAFEPGFTKAAIGDTVKFVVKDPSHSTQSAAIPAGAKSWNGKPDEAVTVKLDKEGVYLYKCEPHLPMGMVGIIQVGKPTNLADVKAQADKLSPTFLMNKDRLMKYLSQVK